MADVSACLVTGRQREIVSSSMPPTSPHFTGLAYNTATSALNKATFDCGLKAFEARKSRHKTNTDQVSRSNSTDCDSPPIETVVRLSDQVPKPAFGQVEEDLQSHSCSPTQCSSFEWRVRSESHSSTCGMAWYLMRSEQLQVVRKSPLHHPK